MGGMWISAQTLTGKTTTLEIDSLDTGDLVKRKIEVPPRAHPRVVSPTRAYLLSSVSAQLGCVHPSKASWPIMAVGFWFICAALGV